jgi:hypothetical protein
MPKKIDKKTKRKTLKKRVAPKSRFQQITDVKAIISRVAQKKALVDKAMEEKRILEARLLALEGKRPLDDRTPYAQRTLYGSGNFNRVGDRYDVGIKQQEQEKKITQLAEQLEEIPFIKPEPDTATIKIEHNKKNRRNISIKRRPLAKNGLGTNDRAKTTTIAQTVAQEEAPTTPIEAPSQRISLITGKPVRKYTRRIPTATLMGEATPNYQQQLLAQQVQNLNDVIQQEQVIPEVNDE